MSDVWRDLFGLLTLIVMVGFAALLIGHAAGTGYLVQQGATGLNTVLNTIELTPTATNGPGTQQTGQAIGGVFGSGSLSPFGALSGGSFGT